MTTTPLGADGPVDGPGAGYSTADPFDVPLTTSTGAFVPGDDSGFAPETGGKASAAKDEASRVGGEALGGAKQVGQTAKEQAAGVAGEAKAQAKDLVGQARQQIGDQSKATQQRAAQGLRSAGDQFAAMADGTDDGLVAQVVRQVGERTHSVAGWLENREPSDLLDEVKRFAARRPGVFIAVAAGAGLLAGRLTKALVADAKPDTASSGYAAGTTPSRPSTYPDAATYLSSALPPEPVAPFTPPGGVGTTASTPVFDDVQSHLGAADTPYPQPGGPR